MNGYLTEKAVKKRWWDIPVGGFSLLLSVIGIEVCLEEMAGSADFAVSLLASVLVMGLLLAPLFFVTRHRLRQRDARLFAKKLAGQRETTIPLDGLEGVTGLRFAARRIRPLIDKDYLCDVSIDANGWNLCLPGAGEKPAPKPAAPQVEPGTEFDGILRRMRRLNDEIEDDAVSGHIDRIEALTAAIFRMVKERPERAEAARKFVQYYLPTAFRLLESYRLMERQDVQSESIRTARQGIEEALGKLADAIGQQHDKLFQAEALDIESDIRVLETMIAADGLLPRGQGLRL